MRRLTGVLSGFIAALGLAAGADAETILGFAPGSSFTVGGITIEFVRTDTGTQAGTYASAGTIGASDLVLVFQATGGSSFDSVGVGVVHCDPGPLLDASSLPVACSNSFPGDFGQNSTGAGAGPDTDPEIDISSITGTAGTRIFNFTSNLDSGETSDEFFVAYADGDISADGTYFINFMISPAVGTDFTQTVQYLIPEPSVLLMLGVGLSGLGAVGRRFRH